MSNNGLIANVEPISDDLRPAFQYDLIENYDGEGYALFRGPSGVYAFGRRIDGQLFEVTATDRFPLDFEPIMFAPISAEQAPSFFFGL